MCDIVVVGRWVGCEQKGENSNGRDEMIIQVFKLSLFKLTVFQEECSIVEAGVIYPQTNFAPITNLVSCDYFKIYTSAICEGPTKRTRGENLGKQLTD